MLSRSVPVLAAALGLALVACQASKAKSTSGGGGTAPTPGSVVDTPTSLTIYTPAFTAPSGDSYTCMYLNYSTTEELTLTSTLGHQSKGGHHILAYYADTPHPVSTHPCSNEEMVSLRQIGGGGADGVPILALPEGLALKVPAGKQIVIQSHYINTSNTPINATDSVVLNKGSAASVKSYVNFFAVDDEGFQIPPNAPYSHTTECTVPSDLQIALGLPHMHELGTHFKLEILDASGNLVNTLIDTDWAALYASHPPVQTWPMSTPYVLKQGQRIRQTCSWNNSTSSPVLFPTEMCVGYFYYWPGNGDISCPTM